jgi:hypothetical protein
MKKFLCHLNAAGIVTALLFFVSACKHDHYEVNGEPVYLKGSPEFTDAVSNFSVTPEAADKLSIEYVSSVQQGPAYARGPLTAVVGEYYVFAFPEKNHITVSGVYVHGNTGAVEERTVDLKIKR